MALLKGDPISSEAFASLPVLFAIWYSSSVFCTALTKVLVHSIFPSAYWLSLTQFLVAAVVGNIAVRVADGRPPERLPAGPLGKQMRRDLLVLSFTFSFGMLALNRGYEYMHVSLVETLRATEPVVSVMLASMFLPSEVPGCTQISMLVPVVFGACLSSFGSDAFSAIGLTWVMASNVCFCLRTIQYKKARREYKVNDWNLFYQICRIGSVWQLVFALIGDPRGLPSMTSSLLTAFTDASSDVPLASNSLLILLNGIMYYTYLQCSWVILMQVRVVTHSVGNAMRRPVVLICNVLYFGNPVSWVNAMGISLAFSGVLLYVRAGSRKAAVAMTPTRRPLTLDTKAVGELRLDPSSP